MIKAKAKKLIANLHLGAGATEFISGLIEKSLDKKCKYCGEKITLKNMQVDHIEPLIRSKLKKKQYSEEELKILLSRDNLQIICKSCNKIKGDMKENDFIWLLKILEEREEVKQYVLKRMKGSSFIYVRTKK